jgi:hypothetical protein
LDWQSAWPAPARLDAVSSPSVSPSASDGPVALKLTIRQSLGHAAVAQNEQNLLDWSGASFFCDRLNRKIEGLRKL